MFGPDSWDQRDYRMGLAGLLAGIQSLKILAERGPATTDDLRIATDGIRSVLDGIDTWREGEREQLDSMLFELIDTARDRELRERNG